MSSSVTENTPKFLTHTVHLIGYTFSQQQWQLLMIRPFFYYHEAKFMARQYFQRTREQVVCGMPRVQNTCHSCP